MLQKIIHLFFAIAVFWAPSAKALVFAAPEANGESFQKFALTKNQQTYTQRMQQKLNDVSVEAHPQVLEFSKSALATGPRSSLSVDWDRLRQSLDLNATDREILILLAEKLKMRKEVCRYLLLDSALAEILETPERFSDCNKEKALQSLRIPESADLLVIDGKAFGKSQVPKKLLSGSYRWKILSNKYEDRDFVGTIKEFEKKVFAKKPWVEGSAKEYKLLYEDLAVRAQSQIFFSESVQRPGLPPERTFSTWASENKILLWGLGVLAAGFAAQQMKDKTLVITKP